MAAEKRYRLVPKELPQMGPHSRTTEIRSIDHGSRSEASASRRRVIKRLVNAHGIPQTSAHGIPQVVDPCVDVLPDRLLRVGGGVSFGPFVGSVARPVHEHLVAGVDQPVQE